MKVSDYIIRYLEDYGIKDVFLLSGGGMMHLLDSVGRSKKINKYYNLNEQATTMCSDGYAQYTNEMSVCMVTTGPGSTNAVTGVVSAYQDSTPMLVISGQVKTSDFAAPKNVRVYGAQEVNIIDIVKSITKYAVTVTDKQSVKYHLQKAIYEANNGRRGPVWIDIPLDIQSADVDVEELKGFKGDNDANESKLSLEQIEKIYESLNNSNKPVILLGYGVVASGASDIVKGLVEKLKIPVLCTWRTKELFVDDYKYYFGMPGSLATRYSNFILQESDFLLVIGSRLNWSLTGFNEPNFAKNAKKFIVDIDSAEMDKLNINFSDKINADAKYFVQSMSDNIDKFNYKDCANWVNECSKMKRKYPIINERPAFESELIYGYDLGEALSKYSASDDVFVASPTGRACVAMNMGVSLKQGQRFVNTMGLGSMGYALPVAIGVCVANGKKRTILCDGDGSLQHNIQELQLLITYKLPIKFFVYSNGGYASIYGMQSGHFKGNYAGCSKESGLVLPSIEKIANAYGINYCCINNKEELETKIQEVLSDNSPVICEVMGDIRFEEIPRTQTRVNDDGSLNSSALEDLYPFLDEKYNIGE